jgi:hypothetical protein
MKSWEIRWAGHVAYNRYMRNTYGIVFRKSARGRCRHRREDGVEVDRKDMECIRCKLDWTSSGYGPVAGSAEHGSTVARWLFQPIQGRNHFSQTTGLLARAISSSQGLYMNTGQHKQNKRIHTPNIYALSGIRTYGPSVRVSEDSSRLRPRGYRDRLASERAKTVHALDRAATVTG